MSGVNNRKFIIEEASKCVLRDRNATHGEAEDNFATIARLWNAYLGGRFPNAPTLNSADVAILSALIKVGRLAGNHDHLDNWIDAVGYFACGGGIVKGRGDKEVAATPFEPLVPTNEVRDGQ